MDTRTVLPVAEPARGRVGRRRLVLVGVVTVSALVAFVLVWFQPQTLFIDTVVDEESPSARPPADEGDPAPADDIDAADEADEADEVDEALPVAVATGSFTSRSRYTVTGTATTFALEDGSRTLRLEDFESTNGPDLYIYLTAADSDRSDAELDADAIDLGLLAGNIGDQNYDVPTDVDLGRYDTVVIWCRRFATSFGVADLMMS